MKIRPVGAELFHADRRTDRRTSKATRFIIAVTVTVFIGRNVNIFQLLAQRDRRHTERAYDSIAMNLAINQINAENLLL